jgi:hypothetical protein
MRRTRFSIVALAMSCLVATPVVAGAQQRAPGALTAPISGVAADGRLFAGTFLVQRFDPRTNVLVAVGTLTGDLGIAGTIGRSVVTQVAIPVSLNPNAVPQSANSTACNPLHLDFASVSVRILGTVLSLDPSSLDIATAEVTSSSTASFSPFSTVSAVSTTGVTTSTGVAASPSTVLGPLGQPVTVPAAIASFGTSMPGVFTPVQNTPVTQGIAMPLDQLLCTAASVTPLAVNGADVAPVLNQIVQALSE